MKNLLLLVAFLGISVLGHSQYVKVYNNTLLTLEVGAQGAIMDPVDCPSYLDGHSITLIPSASHIFTFISGSMTAIRVGASFSSSMFGFDVYPFWTPSPMCLPSAPGPFTFTWISSHEVIIS